MKIQNVVKLALGRVKKKDMIDGGAAVGTFTFAGALPAGMLPMQGAVVCTSAFSGQATVTAQLGTAADPDAYLSPGSVLTKGLINGLGGTDMDLELNQDTDVRLTITVDTDFTALNDDAEVECVLHCIDLNPEEIVETM